MNKNLVYVFNKEDNGGEQFYIETQITVVDKENYYLTHELCLNSYCNTAKFQLSVQLTPEKLREMANEIEATINKLMAEYEK